MLDELAAPSKGDTIKRTKIAGLTSVRAGTRLVAVLAALLLAAMAGAVAAADRSERVSGTFTSVSIPPPACPSPVGTCTRGTLQGGLPAVYDFVMLTLQPAGDPRTATTFVYTGRSTITRTDNGAQLIGEDRGVMRIQPDGTARFVTVVTIVRGTRQYQGASGGIVASGTLNVATGDGHGSYTGVIRTTEDDDSTD